MAALAKRRYTLAEYLEIEKHAEECYVYCGGEVVAMSGASLRHNRIVRNLMRAIDARLEGKPCEVLPTEGVRKKLFIRKKILKNQTLISMGKT